MLDAFIINEIKKKEDEAGRQRQGQQPFLPVPERMPYRPSERESEPVRRGYCEISRDDSESGFGVVIDMASVPRAKYIL